MVQMTETERVQKIRKMFEAAVQHETMSAYQHRSDPHYTNSRGQNLGRDEQLAIIYAKLINLVPLADEVENSALYLARLLRELETQKASFRSNEEDPEGVGIATLHGFSRNLEAFRSKDDS